MMFTYLATTLIAPFMPASKWPGIRQPYMAHVKPGAKEAIVWTFTKPGAYMYGCLIPGHFEAGMKGAIKVVAR